MVFPLCSATYYDPDKIQIELNLTDKLNASLSQTIHVEGGKSQVMLVYVPTKEIGRVMSKYKNALLKYNPRNYLSLSRNPVNRRIRESIVDRDSNEFAILNNGITLTADETKITQHVGKENVGQLLITAPQIINGGQTACTLSEIIEYDLPSNPKVFDGKEVLLKIVTLQDLGEGKPALIQAISNATNRQTKIDETDRRANSPIFMDLQEDIFNHFGYYFERKSGEFYYGLQSKMISKKLVIERVELIRSTTAFLGDASRARRSSASDLFSEENLCNLLNQSDTFREAFFAYRCLVQLKTLQRAHNRGAYLSSRKLGNAFRYGKYSVICAIGVNNPGIPEEIEKIEELVSTLVHSALKGWSKFERFAIKGTANLDYFGSGERDFDNYYKGKTINKDLKDHWRGLLY